MNPHKTQQEQQKNLTHTTKHFKGSFYQVSVSEALYHTLFQFYNFAYFNSINIFWLPNQLQLPISC